MRKASRPQHPLGVLRSIISVGQRELAEMVGRSARTIQAIEINRLPLSEDLAQRISHETGVSLEWLLGGDFSTAPKSDKKTPYTASFYEQRRADLKAGIAPDFWPSEIPDLEQLVADRPPKERAYFRDLLKQLAKLEEQNPSDYDLPLCQIISAAWAARKVGRESLAAYKIGKFAEQMRAEFGQLVDAESLGDSSTVFLAGLTILAMTGTSSGKVPEIFFSPYTPKENWLGGDSVETQEIFSGLIQSDEKQHIKGAFVGLERLIEHRKQKLSLVEQFREVLAAHLSQPKHPDEVGPIRTRDSPRNRRGRG